MRSSWALCQESARPSRGKGTTLVTPGYTLVVAQVVRPVDAIQHGASARLVAELANRCAAAGRSAADAALDATIDAPAQHVPLFISDDGRVVFTADLALTCTVSGWPSLKCPCSSHCHPPDDLLNKVLFVVAGLLPIIVLDNITGQLLGILISVIIANPVAHTELCSGLVRRLGTRPVSLNFDDVVGASAILEQPSSFLPQIGVEIG